MLHSAFSTKVHSKGVVEAALKRGGAQDPRLHCHSLVTEEVVNTDTPGLVSGDVGGDNIATIALVTEVGLGDVIGELGLVEVGAATLALPKEEVVEGVLDGKTVHGDVIAGHHHPVLHWVAGLVDQRIVERVVRPPEPEVVAHHVALVHAHHDVSRHLLGVRATDTGKDIVHEARVGGITGPLATAPLEERRGALGAGLQEDMRNTHTGHVGNFDHRVAVRGHKSGKAKAEENLVGGSELEGLVNGVDAGGKHNVKALGKEAVDLRCAVAGGRNVNLLERNVAAVELASEGALGVALCGRDVEDEGAVASDVDEGLLGNDGALLNSHNSVAPLVGAVGSRRTTSAAHKVHVPHSSLPHSELRVAAQPLLLRAREDSAGNLSVSHVATAGKACSITIGVLVEVEIMGDVDTTEGGSLGDSPQHASTGTDQGEGGLSAEVLSRPPEGAQSTNNELIATLLRVHTTVTVEDHIIRRLTETGDLSVVSNGNILGISARLEQEGITVLAELTVVARDVAAVLGEGVLDHCGDVRVFRAEHVNVSRPFRRVRLHSRGQQAAAKKQKT
eukprot:Colp12_sorted_trinity150504_noHs@20420